MEGSGSGRARKGPELVEWDEASRRHFGGRRYAVVPPDDGRGGEGNYVSVESPQEGILHLVEEYALNFVLPTWEAPGGGPGAPELSAEPVPLGSYGRYGKEDLYEDIRYWVGELSPGADADEMIEEAAGELWRRMMENGGWDESLTLLSWRCVGCGGPVESMSERCPGCGRRDYRDAP